MLWPLAFQWSPAAQTRHGHALEGTAPHTKLARSPEHTHALAPAGAGPARLLNTSEALGEARRLLLHPSYVTHAMCVGPRTRAQGKGACNFARWAWTCTRPPTPFSSPRAHLFSLNPKPLSSSSSLSPSRPATSMCALPVSTRCKGGPAAALPPCGCLLASPAALAPTPALCCSAAPAGPCGAGGRPGLLWAGTPGGGSERAAAVVALAAAAARARGTAGPRPRGVLATKRVGCFGMMRAAGGRSTRATLDGEGACAACVPPEKPLRMSPPPSSPPLRAALCAP